MKATSYSYSEIACPIILGTLAVAVGYWVFRRGDLVKCGAAYLPLMADGQRVEFPVQALAGIDYSLSTAVGHSDSRPGETARHAVLRDRCTLCSFPGPLAFGNMRSRLSTAHLERIMVSSILNRFAACTA